PLLLNRSWNPFKGLSRQLSPFVKKPLWYLAAGRDFFIPGYIPGGYRSETPIYIRIHKYYDQVFIESWFINSGGDPERFNMELDKLERHLVKLKEQIERGFIIETPYHSTIP